METKSYYVTDVAGPRPDIAGKRRNIGERILLTETEARFEISRGTVETQEARDKREETGGVPEAKASGKTKA